MIKGYFGANSTAQSSIPAFKQSPEGLGSTLAQKYPLFMISPHPKMGEHTHCRNMTWNKDEKQDTVSGYNAMRINPVDATARGLNDGDVVRVYNDRGAILCGVHVTERIRPSVVRIQEGGWYTPQQPGVVGSLDLGGNVNVLISGEQPEPVCDGMHGEALVQVEKWTQ
jgi:anaerobic selenocysteine-containing dehydrogenase